MVKYAEEIVATELAMTLHGNRMWSDMSEDIKHKAIKRLLLDVRRLQSDSPVVFSTILRLRRELDSVVR